MASRRTAPLLIVAAAAAAGHVFVVAPLVDAARPYLDRVRPAPAEIDAIRVLPPPGAMEDDPARLLPPGPVPPAPWGGPFIASSLGSRDPWRGSFEGTVGPMGSGLIVELRHARVTVSPEATGGVLRGVRIDLAEATPDGSWRVVRRGRPARVGLNLEPGDTRVLRSMDLPVFDVGVSDLDGRWLVATMMVDAPGGVATEAYAHMPYDLAQRVWFRAERAVGPLPPPGPRSPDARH